MEQKLDGREYLTKGSEQILIEALKEGKSKHEIMIMLNLSSEFISEIYNKFLNDIVFSSRGDKICFGAKTIPYYDETYSEFEAWSFPKYKIEDFSEVEIASYLKTNKRLKMSKIDNFKIDVLLHMNAIVMSNLGTDSTKEEKAYIKNIVKENNKKIKEINKEFFKTIDDGEKN